MGLEETPLDVRFAVPDPGSIWSGICAADGSLFLPPGYPASHGELSELLGWFHQRCIGARTRLSLSSNHRG